MGLTLEELEVVLAVYRDPVVFDEACTKARRRIVQ